MWSGCQDLGETAVGVGRTGGADEVQGLLDDRQHRTGELWRWSGGWGSDPDVRQRNREGERTREKGQKEKDGKLGV